MRFWRERKRKKCDSEERERVKKCDSEERESVKNAILKRRGT